MQARSGTEEIQVWTVSPQTVLEDRPREDLLLLLDDNERARLSRFRFEVDQDAYLVAHALRRLVLARRLSVAPAGIQFEEGDLGRPILRSPVTIGVGFSHSRTRGMVACAVAGSGGLGVDVVETSRHDIDETLLGKYYDAEVMEKLKSLNLKDKARRFYLHWSVLEACGKALGTGLSESLRLSSVRAGTGEEAEIFACTKTGQPARCGIFHFHADARHQVAIAHRNGSDQVRLTHYQFFPRIGERL